MDKIYRNSLFSPVLALVLGYGICLPVVGQAAEKKSTAVPYIFEIVIFVLLFELALIVFLNYPFPVFPFR